MNKKNTGDGIDIVVVNEEEKTMLITEIKINPKKISIKKLEEKSKKLIDKFPNYKVDFKGFSLEDM